MQSDQYRKTLKENFKDLVSSIGWWIFLWGLGMNEQDYWTAIYHQEKNRHN